MISKEEVKKLADLARMEMGDGEMESLRGDMDAILDYVGQVSAITSQNGDANQKPAKNRLRNVTREDENPTEPGTFNRELIAEFPEREGDYLKVKKIL